MWNAEFEEDYGVVLDNGSHSIKAGIAGEEEPQTVFRTVIGTPFYQGQTIGGKPQKRYYVGDAAIENMDVLDIQRPIERGIVTDWDAMERVWHHVFEDLRTAPSDNNVLLPEPPMNPKANREKMAQIMFEKFQSKGISVVSQTVLCMLSSGYTSGLVINSGYEVTDVVCVFEGQKVSRSMFRAEIGGNDITHYLIELLGKRGYTFATSREVEEICLMKEKYGFVSNNPQKENLDTIRRNHTLSNGSVVCLDYERFQCMEAMFKPNLIGSDACGIQELIVKSIKACPLDIRNTIYGRIILTGSNTMTEGIVTRLELELRALLPLDKRIKIKATEDRNISTWIGGSIWGSLAITREMWLTPEEYDEFGPNVIYRSKYVQ